MSIKKLIRKCVQKMLLGINVIIPSRGVPVLLYHSTSNNKDLRAVPNVDLFTFTQQMKFLHETGYITLTSEQLKAYVTEGKSVSKKQVVITFDDGLANNMDAFKIMHQYGFSGFCFLATGFVGQSFDYMPFWLNKTEPVCQAQPQDKQHFSFLSSPQIKEAQQWGIEFFVHTHHHIDMPAFEEAFVRREIEDSLRQLQTYTGRKTDVFSYPRGLYTQATKMLLKSMGFSMAFAVRAGTVLPGSDVFSLPRTNVPDEEDLFKLILTDKQRVYAYISELVNEKQ